MKALLPLSWIYGAGMAIDRRVRMASAPRRERPRVVSIGNLEAGGNGKTPLAMWYLARAHGTGAAVGYISRGFRSMANTSRVVTCVLPDGMTAARPAGTRLLARSHPGLAREIGDEGALVVERVPGAAALFCADKTRAVAMAADLGLDTVVIDDGFQSWPVARHLDIVLLDAVEPLDRGRLLPAGTLRERPGALRRAHAVVFNGAASESALREARSRVQPWLREGTAVAGMTRTLSIAAADGATNRAPDRMLAVSAIARPDAFARSLHGAGVDTAGHVVFRDHHRYDARDVARIVERAQREHLDVVTTEKDWVKLRPFRPAVRVFVARLDVSLIGDPLPA